ncbi:hypothetical protein SLEP1_g15911 [Rubroshorea leprosula]|uniref:Uncharacterized protein n=1 Tax=Rubroshorea leprosula TaxID=152421 RepID=A0AAV5IP26_9ROSI|nr:hypothetical protein SLEP1_g15911 [Rubroshorea leprosula]
MGRNMPSMSSGEDPLIHPASSFPLLVVGMAATMAIITGLCGFRRKFRRRKSSPDPSFPGVESTEKAYLKIPTAEATTALPTPEDEAKATIPLPPPPAMKDLRATFSFNYTPKSECTRTMSVKVPRSMSFVGSQEEKLHKGWRKVKKAAKLKTDYDSVWTKTIVLGEKCRIRDDEDDVVYNGKGTNASRPSTSYPSPSALPLSRQTSSIDPNAIPSQDKQKGKTIKDEDC